MNVNMIIIEMINDDYDHFNIIIFNNIIMKI
jgi:hypothetical protein